MAKRKEITLGAVTAIQSDTYVRADRQRLKQVIVNLLSNAIKYNHIGGRVQVHTQRTGDNRLRIEVRDSGYGIPADKLHRVFSPFDRLDAENTGEEGTGLGLALSQRLVEIMNGTIGVESIEGEGSTFWVELALAEAPVLQQAKEVSDATEVGEASTDQATVLFVEDNLANVRLMERILARRPNTRLISAMQGSLGFELAREHQPSLILLDLNLPDISGKEVLERLKNDPATQKIPVVMVSADAMPKQIDRLLDAGAKDYLTKPVDVDHMLRIVDEVLRREDGHRGRNN